MLIVGGGRRGRLLAKELIAEGHAARIVTRGEAGRGAIEAVGAECWIGTPLRLATLREALESVTVACWLLATAAGPREEVRALHGDRLRFFLGQVVDSTVRGLLYEPLRAGRAEAAGGEDVVGEMCERNEIPARILRTDPGDTQAWLREAREAVEGLLGACRAGMGSTGWGPGRGVAQEDGPGCGRWRPG